MTPQQNRSNVVPLAPRSPHAPLPDDLDRQLAVLLRNRDTAPSEDEHRLLLPVTHHPAAAEAARQLRATLQPGTFAMALMWFTDLSAGVSIGNQAVEVPVRAGAVFSACRHLPSIVWSSDTLVLALQTFEWLPSAAQVFKLLSEYFAPIRRRLAALDAIAGAPPATGGARESPVAYAAPPPPDWVADRTVRGTDPYASQDLGARLDFGTRPHLPVRTVDEMLALLPKPKPRPKETGA